MIALPPEQITGGATESTRDNTLCDYFNNKKIKRIWKTLQSRPVAQWTKHWNWHVACSSGPKAWPGLFFFRPKRTGRRQWGTECMVALVNFTVHTHPMPGRRNCDATISSKVTTGRGAIGLRAHASSLSPSSSSADETRTIKWDVRTPRAPFTYSDVTVGSQVLFCDATIHPQRRRVGGK